ncbi:hypothetical protein [Kribbella ginsengisoli]|uniref:hypothetical protein n=1 Tax=Kribbella ginsengisoli TaxID=363865 RepID=UPI0031DA7A9B
MDVVVQRVRTRWGKESRGGPNAAVRNGVPVAFALPPGPGPIFHSVEMEQWSDYRPRVSTGDLALFGLELTEDNGRCRAYPNTYYPMPPRSRHPAVRIEAGEWLRWQLNYRLVHYNSGEWIYQLDTFNIGYATTDPRVFLGTPPRVIDELGSLR